MMVGNDLTRDEEGRQWSMSGGHRAPCPHPAGTLGAPASFSRLLVLHAPNFILFWGGAGVQGLTI